VLTKEGAKTEWRQLRRDWFFASAFLVFNFY
jgi:hypothetical protein